jgi:hypothetical protein
VWAVEIFGRLRAANGGTLSGFFDVFAWREPGRVGFYEAKVGPDRITPAQLRFVEVALRFHGLEEFMIVDVTGPLPRSAPAREPGNAVDRNARWPVAGQFSPGGQGVLRRAGRDLPQALGSITGPDEPQTRQVLRDVATAIEARR